MITLRLIENDVCIREQTFPDKDLRIGRDETSDFVISHESVSKKHALLRWKEGHTWIIEDVGSRNGIRISHRPLKELKIQIPTRLWIGKQEVEIRPQSVVDTQEVDVSEWEFLERRRGWTNYAKSLAIALGAMLFYTILTLQEWAPRDDSIWSQALFNILQVILVCPLAAGILLVALRSFGRKLRYADALHAIAIATWLPVFVRLFDWLTFYILPLKYRFWSLTLIEIGLTILTLTYLAMLRKDAPQEPFRLFAILGSSLLTLVAFTMLYLLDPHEGGSKLTREAYPSVFGFQGPSDDFSELDQMVDDLTEDLKE